MSQIFPTWIYHESKSPEGLIVNSPAELAALGDGWVDSPAKFGAKLAEESVEEAVEEMPAADAQVIPEFKLDDGPVTKARKRSGK